MSTSVITTRTEPISDSGRTLLMVEFRRQRLRIVTTLFLCRDSVGCITATQLRPNNFQSQTKFGRCQDSEGDSRLDLGKRARARLADSGGQRSKTSPCEALLSKERPPASKNSEALSFDEPQVSNPEVNEQQLSALVPSQFGIPICETRFFLE